jgi:hypothetical protein
MAPRKPTADSANMAPEARPSSVGLMPPAPRSPLSRLPGRKARGLVDMITTPAVAMTIATIIGQVTTSPRKINPKIATWIGSVLM